MYIDGISSIIELEVNYAAEEKNNIETDRWKDWVFG